MRLGWVIAWGVVAWGAMAHALPPRDLPLIERSTNTYTASTPGFQYERIVPSVFRPAPPDAQQIYLAMASVGPVRLESWQIVEQAYAAFQDAIEALAPRFDAFDSQYSAQYFINYPSVKPIEVRGELYALINEIVVASERLAHRVRAENETAPDAGLVAVARLFEEDVYGRLIRNAVWTRYAMLPDLSAMVDLEALHPISPLAQQIVEQWETDSTSLLKRWRREQQGGLDRWQIALVGEGVPEPPYSANQWDPHDRARTIELYRRHLAPAHQLACQLLRSAINTLDALHDALPPDDARMVRVRFGHLVIPMRYMDEPRKLAIRIEAITDLRDDERELIAAWDALDRQLIRDMVQLVSRDPEPYWSYHHRVEPMRPETGERLSQLLQRRDREAMNLAAILGASRQLATDQAVAARSSRNTRPRYGLRRHAFVDAAALTQRTGPFVDIGFAFAPDHSLAGVPMPVDRQWLAEVSEMLGPGALAAVDVNSLATSLDERHREAQDRIKAHIGQAWTIRDNQYLYETPEHDRTRQVHREVRAAVRHADQMLMDAIERVLPIAADSDRLRLRLTARRASCHSLVFGARAKFAPNDPAALIEPLSALLALKLPADVERLVWREIEDKANDFQRMRAAWLAELSDPASNMLEVEVATMWQPCSRVADVHGLQASARQAVDHVNARHASPVGDAALSLFHRIESLLDDDTAYRLRQEVRRQVCPVVWSMEPSALRELRQRAGRQSHGAQAAIVHRAFKAARDADDRVAKSIADLIGPTGLLPARHSEADRIVRILTIRRAEQAELSFARLQAQLKAIE